MQQKIDQGKAFDWGKASADYAKYRDIYPPAFYQKLLAEGLCTAGQQVLDIGTGTGVLPRNLYQHGARFTGTDLSGEQIAKAKELAARAGMEIAFLQMPAEQSDFAEGSFDVITACQCFFYFDHAVLAPKLSRILKKDGRLALLYMAWLPAEDAIAGASERLVLQYNPCWSGSGETRHPIDIPPIYSDYFVQEKTELFDLAVPFTRESWNGRIRACRGIGASLSPEEVARFDQEHQALLQRLAPDTFSILHYAAMAILRRKN